jgi:DNA adenine methylase
MPVITRKVKGGEYLYFREWNAETKEHHDEYLGRKGETETERKAKLKEREAILKEMDTLQTRLTQIDATLGDLKAKIICRPFVKWAGGKSQLIDKMKRYFPETFNRYFEPFLGGAAIFFHLVATRDPFPATLSDSNHDLTNAYQRIRDDVEGLIENLTRRALEFNSLKTKAERNDLFVNVRANPPDIDTQPIERAGWFIFLNKTAYNGLYRVNSQNGFNVPYGGYSNVSFFERDNLRNISSVLNRKGVEIVWADYSEVLGKAKEGDFVYLDPPYFSEDSKGFTAYNASLFTPDDQKKLADTFKALTERKVKVLLSNSKSDFIETEFKKREVEGSSYTYDYVTALRVINCKGSNRTGVKELLIKNY